jgi:hypothetical protein
MRLWVDGSASTFKDCGDGNFLLGGGGGADRFVAEATMGAALGLTREERLDLVGVIRILLAEAVLEPEVFVRLRPMRSTGW